MSVRKLSKPEAPLCVIPLQNGIQRRAGAREKAAGFAERTGADSYDARTRFLDASGFLRRAFDQLEPDKTAYVWEGWLTSVAMMGLEDLVPLAQHVIEENLKDPKCEPLWDDVKDYAKAVKYGAEHLGHVDHEHEDEYAFWTDTLGVFSTWGGFAAQKPEAGRLKPDESWDDEEFPLDYGASAIPAANPYKGIGRNDPCPCGSEKKFKKCCGG